MFNCLIILLCQKWRLLKKQPQQQKQQQQKQQKQKQQLQA